VAVLIKRFFPAIDRWALTQALRCAQCGPDNSGCANTARCEAQSSYPQATIQTRKMRIWGHDLRVTCMHFMSNGSPAPTVLKRCRLLELRLKRRGSLAICGPGRNDRGPRAVFAVGQRGRCAYSDSKMRIHPL